MIVNENMHVIIIAFYVDGKGRGKEESIKEYLLKPQKSVAALLCNETSRKIGDTRYHRNFIVRSH